MRAPFDPRGSFATWTRISSPRLRRSSIGSGYGARTGASSVDGGAARISVGIGSGRRVREAFGVAIEQFGVDEWQIADAGIEIGYVQKASFGEPDVDEGGLHPGEHADNLALVDVAGDATITCSLDVHLGEGLVLDECHAGLFGGRIDEDQFRHGLVRMQQLLGNGRPLLREHRGVHGGSSRSS